MERFAEANKDDEVSALEAVLAEVKDWPDVRNSFQDAFALLRQRKRGTTANGQPVENQNPTGSK